MKWDEFLNDYELNTDKKYHSLPDGAYLFSKVAHDVLECLTAYRICLEILSRLKDNDAIPTSLQWLNRWNIIGERWAKQITSLVEEHQGKYSPNSPEWAKLITDIGNIVAETPNLNSEMKTPKLPNNDKTRQVIESAIMQSKKLELIWIDIQNQDYKRLWTISRYGNLVG